MTSRPTVDRVIDAAIGRLESLRVLLPAARHHLLTELHRTDSYPAATSGSGHDGGHGGRTIKVTHKDDPTLAKDEEDQVPVTGTEAAAIRRGHIAALIRSLDDELNAGRLTLDNLDRDCRRIIGTREVVPRCDGGINLAGYLVPRTDGGWSDPDCHNVPDEGRTVCSACRQRAARWKRARENAA